jgi:hypothetical protein
VSDILRILSWSHRRNLCFEEKLVTFPLAVAEQYDFCAIRLPAEPLNMMEQGRAVPAALFTLSFVE